jgi:hypothetical protein
VFHWSGAFARVAIVCGLLAALTAAGAAPDASGQLSGACGAATVTTLTSIDGTVATNIYRGELGGSETEIDLAHVQGAADLLAAVSADNAASTLAAVKRIVYHPFWHIVRLRVLDASGRLLADFGGPYVISPVTAVLRSAAGAEIGSFVMSVQDDIGFTKLEMRALGDPIGIYVGGELVAALGGSFPKHQPAGPSVTLGGTPYTADTLTFNAFPSGTLAAVIAQPPPAAALTSESCGAVTVAEIGRVAKRLALRFHPLVANYRNYVEVVHSETGAVVVVRIGLRVIAGSEGPGPLAMPASGTVSYEGRVWSVFSFAPTPPATIYLLIPVG